MQMRYASELENLGEYGMKPWTVIWVVLNLVMAVVIIIVYCVARSDILSVGSEKADENTSDDFSIECLRRSLSFDEPDVWVIHCDDVEYRFIRPDDAPDSYFDEKKDDWIYKPHDPDNYRL